MGWSVKKGSGEATVPAPQNLKKNFLVQCVQKIFAFRPKGGGGIAQCPPLLNTPLILTVYVTNCYMASSSSFDNTLDVTSCVRFHVHA